MRPRHLPFPVPFYLNLLKSKAIFKSIPLACSLALHLHMEQTASSMTLLVKSKTHGKAVRHTTTEGQRNRRHSIDETHSHDVEVWPLRLNQQSHQFVYTSADASRLCRSSLSPGISMHRFARVQSVFHLCTAYLLVAR
jgi:hypothetical protein